MFGGKRSKYPVSDAQAKERMRRSVKVLGYIVILILITITGLHAVMIILSESAEFTFWGQTGLVLYVLTVARLAFPLLVELSAAIHTYGALNGYWKDEQKSWGGAIDAVWFLFAAANMITFFAIERGQSLEGWQRLWLNVGLPISGIIAGILVIKMLLADPAHKRAEEEAAAQEERIGNEHAVRSEVESSDAMQLVLARRVWRDYAAGLRAQGYDEAEIDFILMHVPELRSDPAPVRQPNLNAPRYQGISPGQGVRVPEPAPSANGDGSETGRP